MHLLLRFKAPSGLTPDRMASLPEKMKLQRVFDKCSSCPGERRVRAHLSLNVIG